ncbi:hypothetical protein GH714_002676 [Hevea brasiliensis]|uniref:FAS1 domain-containing protein n=1 Tax=Hevea brasiliensis TaxID=3981 RepID=A0A6A6NAA1_HEVBR|nr:hypothetical protein GH714_002676 [Hevea brasiliensis]
MEHYLFSFSLLLLILHCTNTLSQSPASAPVAAPAQAPTHRPSHRPHSSPPPPGPVDVIQILLKAGHFTAFVRLIKATHVDTQLTSQLNSSTDGITIFAPTDAAFSNLRAGALGSLNDREKVAIYEIDKVLLPKYLFPPAAAPAPAKPAESPEIPKDVSGALALFCIIMGSGTWSCLSYCNNVLFVTPRRGGGVSAQRDYKWEFSEYKYRTHHTTISDTVYTDDHLAIYKVDRVLLPLDIFTPKPPAPAPALATTKTKAETPDEEEDEVHKDTSGAFGGLWGQLQNGV